MRTDLPTEVTIRFFVARPLVQGAFLSQEWAKRLSDKVLNCRTAEDRELLPAILRNWDVDITQVPLPQGEHLWQAIVATVWPRRNDYLHKAGEVSSAEAKLGIDCLEALLSEVVDPLATRLGFTRHITGAWSHVQRNPPDFPPTEYDAKDPFVA